VISCVMTLLVILQTKVGIWEEQARSLCSKNYSKMLRDLVKLMLSDFLWEIKKRTKLCDLVTSFWSTI